MDSSKQSVYRFADVELDVSRECLRRNNDEYHLRKKAFQVLAHLLENRDRLVTKNELIAKVWKDAFVTDDVLVQCIKDIRRALGDDSHAPRFIKTIPKSGYRFICPVLEPQNVLSEGKSTKLNPSKEIPESKNFLQKRYILITIASLIAAFTILGFGGKSLWQSKFSSAETFLQPSPDRKTLAVMFFENRTKNPDFDWLREGLTDMLITNLSRSQQLTLLSRQQLHLLLERSGEYKPEEAIGLEKAMEIARRSNAEAFIFGSFSKIGEKIRLDVQLYNSKTGAIETAESLIVENPEQILSEVDFLSIRLVKKLSPAQALEKESPSLAISMTSNLEAYRNYSLAVEKANALQNKEAIHLLERAIELDSKFAMAYARIGYIYAVTWGIAEKAKPYLEKAFSLSDKLSEKDKLNIAAWYSIANLDYPSAIKNFREIIAKFPSETEAYLRLGSILKGEERFEESINVLKQGLATDPDAPLLYNSLGLVYSVLGRHEEAISMHRRYVELKPDEANSHDSLGMSYQWAGLYNEAINEYKTALELNPDFEIGTIHLANTYFQIGRYREAIELYKKYIQISPSKFERARGFSCLSFIYRKLKKYEPAERAARQAIVNREDDVGALMLLALDRGNLKEAKDLEKQLLVKNSTNDRGAKLNQRYKLYYRGYIALKNGDTANAVEFFQNALKHQPPTYDINDMEDCLANAYLELGKLDEAISEYERILRLNPQYPLARFHLAQAFERKGLNEEARKNYESFLEVWKNADSQISEILTARKSLQTD